MNAVNFLRTYAHTRSHAAEEKRATNKSTRAKKFGIDGEKMGLLLFALYTTINGNSRTNNTNNKKYDMNSIDAHLCK